MGLGWFRKNLQFSAHLAMRRAVDTRPADDIRFLRDALPLLTSATAVGGPQDALLIVLQRERKAAERRAVRQGFPPECFGEIRQPKEPHEGRPANRRTGMFESDVVEDYLPGFLAKVSFEEIRRGLPPFAIHALDKYSDRLHQIARRERHRDEILVRIGGDHRVHVEHASGSNDEGDTLTRVAPATMSAWVPSSEDHLRAHMMHEELREALDTFELKVAELMMAGMMHQGDKGEIAKLLNVSPSRIAVAIDRIRKVLQRLGYAPDRCHDRRGP